MNLAWNNLVKNIRALGWSKKLSNLSKLMIITLSYLIMI